MRISARNQLQGTIIELHEGSVNTEIVLQLPSGTQIVSVVTKTSAQSMGLKIGATAYAIIKATSIMIGMDEE
jgi:molybdate transport system regulatory protein